MFPGSSKRKTVSLRGKSKKKATKEQLLASNRAQREKRKEEKRREQAAVRIQSCVRSMFARQAAQAETREAFVHDSEQDDVDVDQLLARLIFFFDVRRTSDVEHVQLVSRLLLANREHPLLCSFAADASPDPCQEFRLRRLLACCAQVAHLDEPQALVRHLMDAAEEQLNTLAADSDAYVQFATRVATQLHEAVPALMRLLPRHPRDSKGVWFMALWPLLHLGSTQRGTERCSVWVAEFVANALTMPRIVAQMGKPHRMVLRDSQLWSVVFGAFVGRRGESTWQHTASRLPTQLLADAETGEPCSALSWLLGNLVHLAYAHILKEGADVDADIVLGYVTLLTQLYRHVPTNVHRLSNIDLALQNLDANADTRGDLVTYDEDEEDEGLGQHSEEADQDDEGHVSMWSWNKTETSSSSSSSSSAGGGRGGIQSDGFSSAPISGVNASPQPPDVLQVLINIVYSQEHLQRIFQALLPAETSGGHSLSGSSSSSSSSSLQRMPSLDTSSKWNVFSIDVKRASMAYHIEVQDEKEDMEEADDEMAPILAFCSLYNVLMERWPRMVNAHIMPSIAFSKSGLQMLFATLVANVTYIKQLIQEGACQKEHLVLPLLQLFCSTLSTALQSISDQEFQENAAGLLPSQLQQLTELLNQLALRFLFHPVQTQSSPHNLLRWLVQLLDQLYDRDSRIHFLDVERWLAPSTALNTSQFVRQYIEEAQPRTFQVLQHIPWVLPFETRVAVFRETMDAQKESTGYYHTFGRNVTIRRDHIVEDGFASLWHLGKGIRDRIQVTFEGEAGIDGGGLFKDFLVELARHAFDSQYGLFKLTPGGRLYPNPASHMVSDKHLELFEFLGRMMGKAIYEGVLLDIPFAKFFLSKLLGKYNDPNELASLDQELHNSMQFIRNYEGDLEELDLTFTVVDDGQYAFGKFEEVELTPGGNNIAVTQENKHQFVLLMSMWMLDGQIKAQTEAFMRGLGDVIPLHMLSMFSQDELQLLISGANVPIDVEDMRAHVQYGPGYYARHPTIDMFWEIVEDMTPEQRASLCKFITSVPRPPLLGFGAMNPPIGINVGSDTGRLPTAATCMNLLKLPPYTDLEEMRKKLLLACEEGATFELS